MKKKTMTRKETKRLIKNKTTEAVDTVKDETSGVMEKINEGVDTLIDETNEVIDKVKEKASEANRRGKAAIRAIKS